MDINKGYTFTSGEANITHTKLNNLLDGASVNTSFLTDKGSVSANPDKNTTLVLAYDGTNFVKGSLSALFLDHTGLLSARTAKTAPVAADAVMLSDSAASGAIKQMTVGNLLYGSTAYTAPLVGDKIPIFDNANSAVKTITLGNVINGAVAMTTPATADAVGVYDSTNSAYKKLTLANALKVVSSLTDKAAPIGADSILIYDSVGTDAKKATIANLAKATGGIFSGVDAGATDAYAFTATPTVAAYFTGMAIAFKAATANTGAATVNVSAIGAVALKRQDGSDVVTGDIVANQWVFALYDGTNFRAQGLSSYGATSNQAVPATTSVITVAHGLSSVPKFVRWVMVCTTAELGYSIGDEVACTDAYQNSNTSPSFMQFADSTNVGLHVNQAIQQPAIYNKSTGLTASITRANWALKCYYAP